MKKKIAIPIAGDKLSEHFGHCQYFAFVDVENNAIINISRKDPPEHQPGTFPRWVAANGATDVIAGGMGPMAVNLFNEAGVNVFVGATAESPQNLVTRFLDGTLKLNANYCDHHGEHGHHDHGHHHH